MKVEVNSEFDLPNIRSRPKTCCFALHLKRAAENQLHTCHKCARVAILSDKQEIFRLFTFDRKASKYSTNIEYARSGQYSNVVEFEFELRHIPSNSVLKFINTVVECSTVLMYNRVQLPAVDFSTY